MEETFMEKWAKTGPCESKPSMNVLQPKQHLCEILKTFISSSECKQIRHL
jgi:hypothetical protein